MKASLKILILNFIKGQLKQSGPDEIKEAVIKKALEDSKTLGLSIILIHCSLLIGVASLAALAYVILGSFSLPTNLVLSLVASVFLALSLLTIFQSIHFVQEKVRAYQRISQTKKQFNFSFLNPLLLELKEEQRKMRDA